MKPPAVILTGSFLVIARTPAYLRELSRRNLTILVITPSSWRDQALRAVKNPAHPASAITDVAFVDGDVTVEGSYLPGVVAAVRRWEREYTVAGICAVGETLVEPTGVVADALGLPSPGLRATRVCRSKYLQRLYLPRWSPVSVAIPAARRDDFDPGRVPFPAVVKPATRHSSSGVWTVRDPAELRARLAGYPAHETVLVEEKVIGPEYSVESLVQGGEVIFSSVTAKRTTASDAFVEMAHTVGVLPGRERDILLEANRLMLDRLGFRDGVAHAEWRRDRAGRPYLMEVAARMPGDGIGVLYRLATGRPLEVANLRVALGEPAAYPAPLRHAREVYLEHTPGVFAGLDVDWPGIEPRWIGDGDAWPEVAPGAPGDPPALRALFVHKELGSGLGPLHSSEDRLGSFFIDAATLAELDALERRVRSAVRVRVLPRDGNGGPT